MLSSLGGIGEIARAQAGDSVAPAATAAARRPAPTVPNTSPPKT